MEEQIAITKTRKVGGSLVVTIPANIVELEQLNEGQMVEIKIKKKRIEGFGLIRGIGEFTQEDRMEDRE